MTATCKHVTYTTSCFNKDSDSDAISSTSPLSLVNKECHIEFRQNSMDRRTASNSLWLSKDTIVIYFGIQEYSSSSSFPYLSFKYNISSIYGIQIFVHHTQDMCWRMICGHELIGVSNTMYLWSASLFIAEILAVPSPLCFWFPSPATVSLLACYLSLCIVCCTLHVAFCILGFAYSS